MIEIFHPVILGSRDCGDGSVPEMEQTCLQAALWQYILKYSRKSSSMIGYNIMFLFRFLKLLYNYCAPQQGMCMKNIANILKRMRTIDQAVTLW
jgi:hypothetical protein